ncbi:MAG: hypothetical protein Ct9H300mP7_4680 [Verrucomicrobiota bacterium]|nr:MAG: hypothetical protein Ct9H300mP7_4680 [Verrucomicrobiota bacterium]
MSADECTKCFPWNEGDLDSTSSRSLAHPGFRDNDGEPLVEKILEPPARKAPGNGPYQLAD